MSDKVTAISQEIGEVEGTADTVKNVIAQVEATPSPPPAVLVAGSDEGSEDDPNGSDISDDISMAEPTDGEEAPYEAPLTRSRRRTTRRSRGGSRGRGRSRSRTMSPKRTRSRRKPAGTRRY